MGEKFYCRHGMIQWRHASRLRTLQVLALKPSMCRLCGGFSIQRAWKQWTGLVSVQNALYVRNRLDNDRKVDEVYAGVARLLFACRSLADVFGAMREAMRWIHPEYSGVLYRYDSTENVLWTSNMLNETQLNADQSY